MRAQKLAGLVFGLLLGFASVASAQLGLGLGVAGGINFASFDDVDFDDVTAAYESASGYHFGFFAEIGKGAFTVRPGVYYMNAGTLFDGGFDDFIDDFIEEDPEIVDLLREIEDVEVQFVSVPIDLKFRLFSSFIVRPYIFAGPEFKFVVSGDDDIAFTDQFEGIVVAGNAGIGFEVALLGIRAYPEIRFSFDVSELVGEEFELGGETVMADKHQSRTVFARIGIGI